MYSSKNPRKSRKSARFSPFFIRRLSSWLVLSTALTLGAATAAHASTIYWDQDQNGINNSLGNGSLGLGALGTWDATSTQWWNGTQLAADQAWVNANNDTAAFWGTAGTVTLGTNITAGGLLFNTASYVINTGANTLSFGATNDAITMNNIASAAGNTAASATITGQVGGSGNVTISGGAGGGLVANTLTLNGTSTGGWTGSTTINNNQTIALSGLSGALASTSGITLNGGNVTLASTTAAEALVNRIADSNIITSNGGTITVNNTVAAATPYSETIGTVALTSGRLNITSAAANTGGTEVLTLTGLTRTGATNSSTVAFSAGGAFGSTNQITVTGSGTTTAGQIIGPWATGGTAANAQNDYVVYNGNNIALANIGASAESTWGTTYAIGNNYTFSTNVGNTTATRNINSLRYTGAGGTIMTLNSFNLNTYGILQGGNTATATIAAAGTGTLSTPTGGGFLYLVTGNSFGLAISAPIVDNGGAVTPVISGSNIVTLSSTSNAFTGGVVVNAGTLSIGANSNLGAVTGGLTFNGSGGLTFTAATTVGTAATPANRAIALNNGAIATITTGAFNSSLIGNISGTGGIILAGTSGNTLTIGQSGSTSTYTGPTQINVGTLKAGVVNAFGTNSAIVFSNTAGTVLDITGFNTAVGSLSGGGTTSGNVTLGAATLTTGGNNESTIYGGAITGAGGSIIKTGTGIQTLLNNGNTYTGTTTVNGGLINISNIGNIGTGAITLAGGGFQFIPNTTVGGATNSADISTISTGAARTITFGAGDATFDANGTQVVLANAVGNGGVGGLTKIGNGTLFLQGANTYTGATAVNGGVLNVQNASALGLGTTGVTVGNGGTLALQGANLNYGSQTLTLNGKGFATQTGALVNVSGNNTYAGPLVLGSSAIVSVDGGSLALSSGTAVTGTGTLTLAGAGSGTLTGSLTHTGGLSKTGAGAWTLSGASGTYAGSTSITGGTLNIVGGALGNTSDTTLGGGALNLTSGSQNIGNLIVAAGTSNTVTLGSGAALTIGSTITRNTGGTVLFNTPAGTTVTTAATGSGSNNVLGYALVNDGGATGMAQINGGNIVRFDSESLGTTLTSTSNSASTDFSTFVTVYSSGSSGTLNWTGGGLTNRSVNSLTIDTTADSGPVTIDMGASTNVLTLSSGALQYIGSPNPSVNATLTGGQVGANNSEVILHNMGGAAPFTLASLISSGTGSLLVDGSGTTILSGNNTYTGATAINGGTVTAGVSSSSTLGTASSNVIGYSSLTSGALGVGSAVSIASGATLSVNGNTVAVGSLSSAGNLVLDGGGTLIVGGNGSSNNLTSLGNQTTFSTISGLVSGTGNLVVNGGTVYLTNPSNSYSGQTVINNGALVISNQTALGTGTSPIMVNSAGVGVGLVGGTLVIQGGVVNGTTPSGITIDRNITFAGRGTNSQLGSSVVSIGNNAFTGVLTTASNMESWFAAGIGDTTFTSSSVLNIAGTGNLRKSGDGNIIINGLLTGGTSGTTGIYQNTQSLLATTISLNNYNNNFIGNIRADSSTIRVANGAALGLDTSLNQLRGTSGTFEIRTDAGSSFSTKNFSEADTANSLTLFVDRAVGSGGAGSINQTVTFGNFAMANNTTAVFAGRDGTNLIFQTFSGSGSGNNAENINITTNGTTTFTGNIWN
ncbi:MAG: beta strand repeat-containing protein, partial [Chthoniobacter sp.]